MAESGEKNEMEQKERGLEWFLANVKDCVEFLTVCWAFLMLTVFPVYVIDHYQDIGAYKFAFFSGISTLFLVPGAVLGLLYAVLKPFGGKRKKVRAAGGRLSWLDIGMLAYLLFNILSFLGSGFKEDAWAGVGGWNMGLRTQLLMIAAYFLLSRFFPLRRRELIEAGAMLGSGIAFCIVFPLIRLDFTGDLTVTPPCAFCPPSDRRPGIPALSAPCFPSVCVCSTRRTKRRSG